MLSKQRPPTPPCVPKLEAELGWAWGQVLYDDGEDEWLDLRAEAARALPPAAVSAGLPTGADPAAAQPFLQPGLDVQLRHCLRIVSLSYAPHLPSLVSRADVM